MRFQDPIARARSRSRPRWLFRGLLVPAVLFCLVVLALQGTGDAASPSGAIFTTTPDGSIVNENVRYNLKIEVYLDGGPPPNAPQTAAGLDDGFYVFQVTDPPGKFLLSRDPARCRVVEIDDGVIIRRVPATDPAIGGSTNNWKDTGPFSSVPCHVNDNPPHPTNPGVAGASGQHDTNVDSDHGPPAVVVQLMPFGTTPNPGGVYKAWMIPISAYLANGGNLNSNPPSQLPPGQQKPHSCPDFCAAPDRGFGPNRANVKTDNFKVEEVVPPPMCHVRKFHDIDGDGEQDAGEPEIGENGPQCVDGTGNIVGCETGGGWPIDITDPNGVTNHYFTPVDIVCEPPGRWVVQEETLAPKWAQSVAILDNVSLGIVNPVNVTVVGTANESHEVIFGNFMPGKVCGKKVIDLNANRSITDGDSCDLNPDPWGNNVGCQGVTVNLDGTDNLGNAVNRTTTTDEDGKFCFLNVNPGSYLVTVDEPVGFECSFPNPCDYTVDLESGEVINNRDFGDFSRAEIHGRKFIDLNGNGSADPGEGCPASPDVNNAGCQGVTVHLDGTDGMGNAVNLTTSTDSSGAYSFLNLKPGSYTITVDEPPGFECSYPSPCERSVTLVSDQISRDNNFGDFSRAEVHGRKFIDLNGNGSLDGGDGCPAGPAANNAGCQDITIHLFGTDGMGGSVHQHTTTSASGVYSFTNLKPGSYKVCEEVPSEFFQSFPSETFDCTGHAANAGGTVRRWGYSVTLVSDQVVQNRNFGNFSGADIHARKFFDFNENEVKDGFDRDLQGIQFCLKDGGGNLVDSGDFVGTPQSACQTTDSNGLVWWMDLKPGTYTVVETLPAGFFGTTPTSVTITVVSDEARTLHFGNVANCVGLTPGYWVNWRNHYTSVQFLVLLQGTIAAGNIALADFYLSSLGCDNGDALHCMRRFLLANQLTLNLTQNPGLPNPSGGSLFRACLCPGAEESLGEIIDHALEILANPAAFSRDEILRSKGVLECFATENFRVN